MSDKVVATSDESKQIERIADYPGFMQLEEADKRVVWKLRHTLKSNPRMLHKMFASCLWQSEEQVSDAFSLFETWSDIQLDNAFTLLSAQYSMNELFKDRSLVESMNDRCKQEFKKIRAFALKHIVDELSNSQVELYMLQLV